MAQLPALIEPLTPADCDLRAYPTMPLDVRRLRDSGIASHEDPEVFRAAIMLWCAAWHQVPAASLPNEDRELAKLAGFGRFVAEWLRVKEAALHGFQLCSDGRLYHRVVAEMARPAWETRKKYLERSRRANEARHGGAERRSAEGDLLQGGLKPSYKAPSSDSERNGTERNGSKKGSTNLGLSGEVGGAGEGDARPKGSPPAKAKKKPGRKGSRLSLGWTASAELRAYAAEQGFAEEEIDQIETDFRLWWPAQPGQKGVKVDWALTWKTWVRTEAKRRNGNGNRARAGGRRVGDTDDLGAMHSGFMAAAQRRAQG